MTNSNKPSVPPPAKAKMNQTVGPVMAADSASVTAHLGTLKSAHAPALSTALGAPSLSVSSHLATLKEAAASPAGPAAPAPDSKAKPDAKNGGKS